MDADATHELRDRILAANASATPLEVVGGGSKRFMGRVVNAEALCTRAHRGILSFDPSELIVKARCGTRLADIEAALSSAGQYLAFEPPHYGADATLGGAVAAGLAGPRRAYTGAVKDFVLGTTLLSGDGKLMHFGGEVMKNVAGFDVSRFMAGSFGTLAVLLDVSLKVLPRPPADATFMFEADQAAALSMLTEWALEANCISASAWCGGQLTVRLSGSPAAIDSAALHMGGAHVEEGEAHWRAVREQTHDFFAGDDTLVRVVVPASTPPLSNAPCLCEWGGAQRWYRGAEVFEPLAAAAAKVRGFATLFRSARDDRGFVSIPEPLAALHRSLKKVFDPNAILNPHRLWAEL